MTQEFEQYIRKNKDLFENSARTIQADDLQALHYLLGCLAPFDEATIFNFAQSSAFEKGRVTYPWFAALNDAHNVTSELYSAAEGEGRPLIIDFLDQVPVPWKKSQRVEQRRNEKNTTLYQAIQKNGVLAVLKSEFALQAVMYRDFDLIGKPNIGASFAGAGMTNVVAINAKVALYTQTQDYIIQFFEQLVSNS